MSRWKKIRHRFELVGVRFLIFLPSVFPLKLSVRFSSLLGILAFDVFRVRRRVSLENITRAFGDSMTDRDRIKTARRSYINFAKSMVEFASLQRPDRERLLRLVSIRGRGHIDEALAMGRGVVVVTGHFGSWEFLGAAAIAHGLPADFLVGEQSNTLVDDLMNGLRRKAGIGIISRGAGARGIFSSLKKGRMVAIISDQDARKHGVFADFFGIPASTFPGAAQFAYRTGAPIVFCYIVRQTDESHETVFLPPIIVDTSADKDTEILRLTVAHVRALEDAVRKHPDHYFWAHRRWKTKPPEDRS
ncbi:MAG: lysophospholipid acyltransferase family protein [Candidatus Krumholzibacteria bacterium]|nr:lysophospholipid acyltransferase family protein [Candidatus Krumholzibacteria bacterium]